MKISEIASLSASEARALRIILDAGASFEDLSAARERILALPPAQAEVVLALVSDGTPLERALSLAVLA